MERPESTLFRVTNQHRRGGPGGALGAGARRRQRRRRSAGAGATAGRRPWSTLTCDADRYGDACRDCHVCAVHERKRPSRMREWQWAETVNRTEKGGGLRARLSARRDLSTRRDRADARDRNRIWGYRILSDPYRSYDPGSRARALRRAFSSFTTVRARGVVCGDVLLRCTAVVLLRRVRGNNFNAQRCLLVCSIDWP